jgi:hypothetical protein
VFCQGVLQSDLYFICERSVGNLCMLYLLQPEAYFI